MPEAHPHDAGDCPGHEFRRGQPPELAKSEIDPTGRAPRPGRAPPDVGSVELASDGSFTYQAPPGFVGRAEFEYVVSDGLDESTAVVRIRIRVSRGIIDSEDREEVVAAVTTESRDAGRLAVPAPILTRSFVALSRSASVQINMLSIPLVLLGGLAVMAVTLGRVGSTPWLASRAQYGVLASFHESEGFGHIVTDDGIEYFVSRGAFKGKVVAVGSKVSFRAISAEPRYLAVRVWGV